MPQLQAPAASSTSEGPASGQPLSAPCSGGSGSGGAPCAGADRGPLWPAPELSSGECTADSPYDADDESLGETACQNGGMPLPQPSDLLASWLLSSGDANLRRHAAGVLAAVSATWRHPLLARAMPCFALGRCALPGRWAYQARCKGAGDDASRSMCLQVNLATCISLWCGSAASAGTPWTPPAPTHPAGPTPPSFQPPEPAPLAPAPPLEHKKRHGSAAPKGGPTKHRRSQDGGARA